VSPEQRHKLQNSSKSLLKEKSKEKHSQRSSGPQPGGAEALISLFKPNLQVVKREKSGQYLWRG
jgi:hypothetical protein